MAALRIAADHGDRGRPRLPQPNRQPGTLFMGRPGVRGVPRITEANDGLGKRRWQQVAVPGLGQSPSPTHGDGDGIHGETRSLSEKDDAWLHLAARAPWPVDGHEGTRAGAQGPPQAAQRAGTTTTARPPHRHNPEPSEDRGLEVTVTTQADGRHQRSRRPLTEERELITVPKRDQRWTGNVGSDPSITQ